MHRFSVNYLKRDGHKPGQLVNRGFWLNQVPRPLLPCRIRGHRPVIDGTEPTQSLRPDRGIRWVCCDRCGIRPEPQGSLDPDQWAIGQPYTGPLPGPWPTRPTGTLGAQIVIGRHFPGPSVEVKIGNKGSEHTIAAHVSLGRVGALYLHTERFGSWLVRRLNPAGYNSRVTGLAIQDGCLHWQVWAKRNEWSKSTPRWQYGSVRVDLRNIVLGERRYSYELVGDPVPGVLRMPHGDDYDITLQLKRESHGRARGRSRRSWLVSWEHDEGVPTRPGSRSRVGGLAVHVSAVAVERGTWPAEALAGIAAKLTEFRAGYGWRLPDPAANREE